MALNNSKHNHLMPLHFKGSRSLKPVQFGHPSLPCCGHSTSQSRQHHLWCRDQTASSVLRSPTTHTQRHRKTNTQSHQSWSWHIVIN